MSDILGVGQFGDVFKGVYQETVTFGIVFSEREAMCYRPSVCRLSSVCLSSVTFVRPTQAVQIFRNISTVFGTLAIR